MGKKLLIVNTYANLWSTGRIAAEIGEIAVKHGWQCYFAGTKRFESVSSIRKIKSPPCWRANR